MNFCQSTSEFGVPPSSSLSFKSQSFQESLPNRFIYVNNGFNSSAPSSSSTKKVLVNPHFKKKVYFNPDFNRSNTIHINAAKPLKIHVNPNVLKKFTVPILAPQTVKNTNSLTTMISTRNKLVRVPYNSSYKAPPQKRPNSLHTKYKIVRTNAAKISSVKVVNRFTFDKTSDKFKMNHRAIQKTPRSIRKKFVYVNRFLSMNLVAKTVLFKKSGLNKSGFININGIMYKKSPNSLKKATDSILWKKDCQQTTKSTRRSLVKRYKIVRSKNRKSEAKMSLARLRKCNISCPFFRKFGKCSKKDKGTCLKVHNPDQIVLCSRFLQGACHNKECLLSHKVSHEKMPTCKFYLEGLCSKDDCPYLHVKINPKADICRDFVEGFCKKGAKCNNRHQLVCPAFEKNRVCSKKRCPYPHHSIAVRDNMVLNTLAKKCSTKQATTKNNITQNDNVSEYNRYYKDLDNTKLDEKTCGSNTLSKDRPQLGRLPEFIPLI